MKTLFAIVLSVVAVFALTVGAQAADVTLKGTITCAKCDLKVEKECTTVIKVKEDGKDVVYYFDVKDEQQKKDYHKKICQTPTEGTVTGAVSEKEGKKYITPTKVEFK